MRVISVLMAGAVLASCSTGPGPAPTRTAEKQREYQALLMGKVPLAPISCLPHYRSGDMRRIDEETILFRDGSRRVYVAHMQGGCSGLDRSSTALVTRQFGSADLCRGDIAQVVDTLNRFPVGSCVFGDFVPYVTPGTRG
ncbi:MAG: hypothetical protein JOZ20_01005 [Sphingomonas sp.]|nr:hypothetical protein [Sphingomonas sp.]MBW0006261.1 hypothetical protein [Sphingomonas sp.]